MALSFRPTSQRSLKEDVSNSGGGSVYRHRSINMDSIEAKKYALTQEFKELYREKNLKSNDTSAPLTFGHKLRNTLDGILSDNKRRRERLEELSLRHSILKKDDLSGQLVDEEALKKKIESKIQEYAIETGLKWRTKEAALINEAKGAKSLLERYLFSKRMYEKISELKENEDETKRILEAKINNLVDSQQGVAEKIAKTGFLTGKVKRRFNHLQTTELTAKNKLIRVTNKITAMTKEVEKQKAKEENYFKTRRQVLKKNHSDLEGFKEVIAKNLVYKEEIKIKKEELDERLDELTYEEKQILAKRQSSEYILLYIDLLDNLENNFIKQSYKTLKTPESANNISREGPLPTNIVAYNSLNKQQHMMERSHSISMISTPRQNEHSPDEPGSRRRTTSVGMRDTNEKRMSRTDQYLQSRDVVVAKIAQFSDTHQQGTEDLVNRLLHIHEEMHFNEQSLGIRHQELNLQRLQMRKEVEELEHALAQAEKGFVLVDEPEFDSSELQSPVHAREKEKRILGTLGHYDSKTVGMTEFLVNLCAVGVQNTLNKLTTASSSLCKKAVKVCPVELAAKVHQVEAFLNAEKEPEPEPAPVSHPKKTGDNSPSLKRRRASAATTSWANSTRDNNTDLNNSEDKKDTQGTNSSFQTQNVSQQHIQVQVTQVISPEVLRLEALFKSCIGASPEIVYKWTEKVVEDKWLFDFLGKDAIKEVLGKYSQYYGSDITLDLLEEIFTELKTQARTAQKRKVGEMFDHIESLLTTYQKQYKAKKHQLSQKFDMEIGSEILDSPQRTMHVSPFVERAHGTRLQHFNLDGPNPKEEDHKNKKDNHNDHDRSESHVQPKDQSSDQNEEAESLGGNSPKAQPEPTTRDKLKDLHGEYIQRKRATASSQGLRSYSMPKLRNTTLLPPTVKKGDMFGKTMTGNFVDKKELRNTDTRAELMKKITSAGGKKTTINDKKQFEQTHTKELARTAMNFSSTKLDQMGTSHSATKKAIIPRMFFETQRKQEFEENFLKKLIKDDGLLKTIRLLEKQGSTFQNQPLHTERKSTSNYVPNFSLLQKYGLNKQNENTQTVEEWWRHADQKTQDLIDNRGMSTEPSGTHRKSIIGGSGHRASYRISAFRKGSIVGRSSSVKPYDRSQRKSIASMNKSSVDEEEEVMEDKLFDHIRQANTIFAKSLETKG